MTTRRSHLLHLALLLLIIGVAAALRLYRLGEVPHGLYQDEAYNGLDALAVLTGARPLYFSANNGREPLFIYLAAVSVGALGRSALALRLPAAVLGVLTIPATYALGRALYGARVGLWAAGVGAAAFWPLALSRIGLRAVGLPLLAALAVACAAHGVRLAQCGSGPKSRPSLAWLALGGLFYGLSFYTYLAARFTPLGLFGFLFFWYIARRQTFPTLRQLLAFGGPALLAVLPLGLAALAQPEILLGRAGQVSVLNPAINGGDLWGTLLTNLRAAGAMFLWRGDDIARHNLPGRPVFDPALGLAFAAGAALAVARAVAGRSPRYALPLVWTGVLLLPTILAEDTPHFLRGVGALPFIFLFPALALDGLWSVGQKPGALAGRGAAVAVLVLGLALTARDYFGRYANSPTTGYLFQSAATELARASRVYLDGGEARRLYLDRRFWDQFPSVRFLLPESPRLVLFDEGAALPPESAADFRVVTWPYEPMAPTLGVLPAGALVHAEAGPLYRGDLEAEPYPLYVTFSAASPCPPLRCAGRPVAEFEGGLALLSYAVRPTAEGMVLELVWQARQPPGEDHQVSANALAGETWHTQADGPLGTVYYPSRDWRAGETVLETRAFPRPPAEAAGDLFFIVALYDPETGARLARLDEPGDSVRLSP